MWHRDILLRIVGTGLTHRIHGKLTVKPEEKTKETKELNEKKRIIQLW